MVRSGDVIEIPEVGVRVAFRSTAAETGGELAQADVLGRPRGFLTQEHAHLRQTERIEVLRGGMTVIIGGAEHQLGPGDAIEIPAGVPHRQLPRGEGDCDHRLTGRPAGRSEELLERLARLSREGRLTGSGWLRPTAAAELYRDFGGESRATRLGPDALQRVAATAILDGPAAARRAVAGLRERLADGGGEYVFADEWHVAAPPDAVFDALADARTYTEWWREVYLDVESDGPPGIGQRTRQHFKGRLPYHLHTTSTITRLERPRVVQGDVEGDLRGRGTWTLTPRLGGTHVRFDWRVFPDRPLLRTLGPVLRPLFRWNHDWAVARARDGLEPYAQRTGGRVIRTGRFRRTPV